MGFVHHPNERVLVVEDDEALAGVYRAVLDQMGLPCEWVATATEAKSRLADGPSPALVLTDLGLADGSGMDVIRATRHHFPGVRIVVATGTSKVADAVAIFEAGAYRVLTKPIDLAKLRETLILALEGAPAPSVSAIMNSEDARLNELDRRVTSALGQIYCLFQPIVDVRHRRVFAYEALLRCQDVAYRSPLALLSDAARVDKSRELSRGVRAAIGEAAKNLPDGPLLFVNLQADDLTDPLLFSADDPLAPYAHRVVLELTEQARLNGRADVKSAIADLRARGYRVAIDDLGAGYSSLALFVELAPDFVKVDMSLVRGIDGDEVRQQIVAAMLQVCSRKRTLAILEGVETQAEDDALQDLGARWMQGYLFARPSPPFVNPFAG